MHRPALLPAALFVVSLTVAVPPAAAQYLDHTSRDYSRDYGQDYGRDYDRGYGREYDRGYGRDYGHASTRWGSTSATAGWRSQLDRPGDYRCDPFWDASRTDCAAPWRDQRRSRGYGHGYDHGYGWANAGHRHTGRYSGYGQTDPYYRHPTAHGGSPYGYSSRRRGYGQAPRYTDRGEAWHGAYGRPDLIYSNADNRGARDPRRIAWCRSSYRSYDPGSGYYRAYSGRLIYCG